MSPPRSAEARALRHRLTALAVGGLFGPLLCLLALAGWRQLEAERQLRRVGAADELGSAGRAAARALESRLRAQLGACGQVVVDEDGRAVAPGLPGEEGLVAELDATSRAALAAGRTLELSWGDRRAARDCFAALRERWSEPGPRAAAGLELLGTCAAAGDWPAVRATAEALLREHVEGGGRALGRTEYLHTRLLRVEALERLGEDAEARRAAGQTLLELRLAAAGGELPGVGFYRERLARAGPPPPPAWAGSLERALQARLAPGPLRGAAPGSQAVLLFGDGALGVTRLEGAPPRFALGPLALEAELAAGLEPLVRRGARAQLVAADGLVACSLGGAGAARGAVRAVVPLGEPLRGWSLELHDAPPVGALDRQALVLLGLLGAALLVLGATVWLLLRDASRAVDLARVRADLVAGVAHDLKTPLSMIRLYAETLRLGRATDEAERARFLDVVIGEADRLADLVDDALSVARGQAPLQLDASDLAASVREAAAPLVPLSGGRLSLLVADGLPPVAHDPRAVRRVVRNLLQNALKFAPPGTPVVLRLEPAAGGASLTVEDRGPGIPAAALARLGEPGFRAAPGAAPGSGLGLMVVSQLVDAHGGRLAIHSAEGQGTRVTVTLPAAGLTPTPGHPDHGRRSRS